MKLGAPISELPSELPLETSVRLGLQEKEMEKQKMLYQQARLHDRGAAEMVLQMISASKGWTHSKGRRACL